MALGPLEETQLLLFRSDGKDVRQVAIVGCQAASIERQCLLVVAVALRKGGQQVERPRSFGMVGAQAFLPGRRRGLEEWLRLVRLAVPPVVAAEVAARC